MISALCAVAAVLALWLIRPWGGAEAVLSEVPLEVELASMAPENIPSVGEWQRRGDEAVTISPDGRWIAIAGHDELVHLYDVAGREKWKFKIPESYGKVLAFSGDARLLFAGECSVDGTLYAIDVDTGKKKWTYSVAPDVGRPAQNRPVTYQTLDKCCVYALAASETTLFAAGTHRDRRLIRNPGRPTLVKDVLDTVVYAFDPGTGKKLWRYPADETMDSHMPYLVYSKALDHLFGANTSYWRPDRPVEKYPNGTLRLIHAQKGAQSSEFRILPSFTPFVSIWYSLSISPNGKYASAGTVDGRMVVLDVQEGFVLKKRWEKEVSTLLEVSGIPIYTSISHSFLFDNGDVFVTTGSTHAKQTDAGVVRRPPNQHPDCNCAFVFNKNGDILWRWKAAGDITQVCFHPKSGIIVIQVEHDYLGKSLNASGFYFMKYTYKPQKPITLLSSLLLNGITTSGAMSPDGSFFAGIELPVRLTDDTLAGEHKLHIVPIRFIDDAFKDR